MIPPAFSPAASPQSVHATLRERAFTVLSELLAPGTPCALVDFPHHDNVGDSAIWLGERALLRRAAVPVAYTCDLRTFAAEELERRLPAGTILIHGGGNLGDLWPAHQEFRERIVATFPRHRIIQLPQSIHFNKPANLERARAVFDSHPDLTICVRDRRSLDLARGAFKARSLLCPDMAFGLEDLTGTVGPAEYDIMWQARLDCESAGQLLPRLDGNVLVTDWAAGEGADASWTARRRSAERAYQAAEEDAAARVAASDLLAELQLSRGCRLLASGRAVVTDRLHGHLLSLLLGLPHVRLADRYGKIASSCETWDCSWPLARSARTPHEALAHAMDLVARQLARRPALA